MKPILLKHSLVPKHTIMTKSEVEAILEYFGLNLDQFPKIKSSDPIVKEIGARKGDVIRIIRQSPVAGEAIYYRVVV